MIAQTYDSGPPGQENRPTGPIVMLD